MRAGDCAPQWLRGSLPLRVTGSSHSQAGVCISGGQARGRPSLQTGPWTRGGLQASPRSLHPLALSGPPVVLNVPLTQIHICRPPRMFRPHGVLCSVCTTEFPTHHLSQPLLLPAPSHLAVQPGIQAQHPDLGDVFDSTLPLTLLGPPAAPAPLWRSVCTCGAPRVPGIATASPQVLCTPRGRACTRGLTSLVSIMPQAW